MKFKSAIAAMLAALLAVNTVGLVLLIKEEKAQTEIAKQTAELTAITAIVDNTVASSIDTLDDATQQEIFDLGVKQMIVIEKMGISVTDLLGLE